MSRSPHALWSLALLVALISTGGQAPAQGEQPNPPAGDFQLKDGDRVVFLGDSLTASRAYGNLVEQYTLVSYPDRKVRFFNAGRGGDTAQGALKRLDTTVLNHKPTVVTVCIGVNDIGWGMWGDAEHVKAHHDGIRAIIKRCQEAGARVYILGPCVTALSQNLKEPEPRGENILDKMSIEDRRIAAEMGAYGIDLYGQFRELQWKLRKSGRDKDVHTHAGDTIHLSEVGNLIFAYVLLKGLGAPDNESSLEIDASKPEVTSAFRCKVEEVTKDGGTLRFVRKDEGWPLHLGEYAWIQFATVPTSEKLSGYRLKVTGLQGSDFYRLRVNGQDITTMKRQNLAEGVNLAYAVPQAYAQVPPWKVQSNVIQMLVQARSELASASGFGALIVPGDKEHSQRLLAATEKQIEGIENLQHLTAQTKPLRFEIVPAAAPETKAKPGAQKLKAMKKGKGQGKKSQ